MDRSIPVRQLTAPEVHMALAWAGEEGWNPGLSDAACFYTADPGGFWAALHNDEPAAVISLVRYGPEFGFLGLYICRPDLRGRGYGTAAWNAAMQAAGNRVIGLDGVPAQQDTYRRRGFHLAWRSSRYQGTGMAGHVSSVIDLDRVPFAQIASYDRTTFEAERQRFLRSWIAQPGAVRLGVMRNGELVGWGVLRPCAEGYKIGPLMADDAPAAESLLDGFLAAVPGETVSLDVPQMNTAAVLLAETRGMSPVFETARMYNGAAPSFSTARVWGITSFELG